MLGDAKTGKVRTVLLEQDSTWVDVVDDVVWLDNGKSFTWVSDRDGWNHVYVVSRDGKKVRLVTQGDYDVLEVQGIDPKSGWLYYIASPENPVQRYLFRSRLDGKGKPERLSPARESGTHVYDVAPSYKYAIETYSSLGNPPIIRLVRLAGHQSIRTLVDNQQLRSRVSALQRGATEWFNVEAEDGSKMPGVLMKPADFDSTRKYPLLFFVYGGPGKTEVNDVWGGYWLWHTMLTQKGYLVAIVDNRGTPAPLGKRFRKAVYGQLGVLETRDQAIAARTLAARPYVDPARIGIWGWSYGGFMTLNTLFQHPELYRTGVAVSPVTHWALYDNVYTERFNGLITDNREGYDRGSPHQLRDGTSRATSSSSTGAATTTCTSRTRDADQRPGGRGAALRDDGIPQSDALHLPGERHPSASLRSGDALPRPKPDGRVGPACPGARGRGALSRAWRPGGTDPRLQSPLPPEPSMTYEDIVALLGYAGGHEQKVRITTTDRTEVVGIPMSVDTHITAHEVYLRPAGSDDTEIAVSLGAIRRSSWSDLAVSP